MAERDCFLPAPESLDDALAKLVHELGHLLPAGKVLLEEHEPTRADHDDEGIHLAACAEARIRPPVPWQDHGADFIRRVLHLHFRLARLGLELPLPSLNVAGYWQYGLSMPEAYRAELAEEPERLVDAPFAEIEATEAPAGFTALFASDASLYFDRRHELRSLSA